MGNDDDVIQESEIVGTWQLVVRLSDPVYGSGTFRPDSGKTLVFTNTGIVSSNVEFYLSDATAISSGTYDRNEQRIMVNDCNATYEFNNQFLEVYFFCIEACAERYINVE